MVDKLTRTTGKQIIKCVEALRHRGITVKGTNTQETAVFNLEGRRFRIEITVNPGRWLGLKFSLIGSNGKSELGYDIDTDLYPIEKPEHQDFAKEIESNIIVFLQSLDTGRIQVGKKGGRPTMIFPEGDGFRTVTKGRIFTRSVHHKDADAAGLDESFSSLIDL